MIYGLNSAGDRSSAMEKEEHEKLSGEDRLTGKQKNCSKLLSNDRKMGRKGCWKENAHQTGFIYFENGALTSRSPLSSSVFAPIISPIFHWCPLGTWKREKGKTLHWFSVKDGKGSSLFQRVATSLFQYLNPRSTLKIRNSKIIFPLFFLWESQICQS